MKKWSESSSGSRFQGSKSDAARVAGRAGVGSRCQAIKTRMLPVTGVASSLFAPLVKGIWEGRRNCSSSPNRLKTFSTPFSRRQLSPFFTPLLLYCSQPRVHKHGQVHPNSKARWYAAPSTINHPCRVLLTSPRPHAIRLGRRRTGAPVPKPPHSRT